MRAFAFPGGRSIYIAYLDEFGHVGPYVLRTHPRHNDNPVFGFAGFVMPAEEWAASATGSTSTSASCWTSETRRSGEHPATWEKKGASLYRAANLRRYRQLRRPTNRLLGRIERSGGHVFYVEVRKRTRPGEHDANSLYSAMLREAIQRLHTFCTERPGDPTRFILALDEHPRRAPDCRHAGHVRSEEPRRRLIEPPFHLESHCYQTVQAADRIAGLAGHLGACWKEPAAWPENAVFRRYFESWLTRIRIGSGIRD